MYWLCTCPDYVTCTDYITCTDYVACADYVICTDYVPCTGYLKIIVQTNAHLLSLTFHIPSPWGNKQVKGGK